MKDSSTVEGWGRKLTAPALRERCPVRSRPEVGEGKNRSYTRNQSRPYTRHISIMFNRESGVKGKSNQFHEILSEGNARRTDKDLQSPKQAGHRGTNH